jgi:hypothetical protein
VWRIGNGESIKIADDNWIPRSRVQRPLGRLQEECPERVCDFIIDEGSAWDVEKVMAHFVPLDVTDILRTPVGRAGTTDFLAWNFTKNGVFSVKTAYHLALQKKKAARGASESSSSCDDHKGWLLLWDAQVPNKNQSSRVETSDERISDRYGTQS